MPKNGNRGGNSRGSSSNDSWSGGVMDMARERPMAAAAVAAGAAAAGLFLWSKRGQISQQISDLSDQVGEWTDNMRSGSGSSSKMDDTAGLTTSGSTRSRSGSGSGSRSTTSSRGRSSTGSRNRGMSETGGGNASLGAHSGGIGTTTTGSPSARGRAAETTNS